MLLGKLIAELANLLPSASSNTPEDDVQRLSQSEDSRFHRTHDDTPQQWSRDIHTRFEKCFGDTDDQTLNVTGSPLHGEVESRNDKRNPDWRKQVGERALFQ